MAFSTGTFYAFLAGAPLAATMVFHVPPATLGFYMGITTVGFMLGSFLSRIIHEKCAIKAKPLISFTTMRMGCLVKFFAMKSLAQLFGGLGRFRAVR